VMIQWAWSYLTYERGARLITGSDELPGWPQSQENGGATGVSPIHPSPDAPLSTSTPDAPAVTVTPPRL
jgi:NADH:ubiquinone reductase (H+-translocating)